MVLQSQMPAVAQLYSCFIILLKLNMSHINIYQDISNCGEIQSIQLIFSILKENWNKKVTFCLCTFCVIKYETVI